MKFAKIINSHSLLIGFLLLLDLRLEVLLQEVLQFIVDVV
jgi:hypothetical protein